jgi:hypothetical protein
MKNILLPIGFIYVWATSFIQGYEMAKGNSLFQILFCGATSATMLYFVLKDK